jgi:S-DNA-T family DNA segregation ATPase FtsK/SpoIIIE
MILEEVESRKKALAESGYGSYGIYRQAGKRDMPQLLILIDNIGNLRDMYEKYDDTILMLCRDGISVGISVIVTTSQTSRLGYRYLSNFSQNVCFHCTNSGEYSSVFDKCKLEPDENPGRFIISLDRKIYEGQCFEAFSAENDSQKIEVIGSFVDEVNEKFKDAHISRIPVMPAVVNREYFDSVGFVPGEPYENAVAVSYLTTELLKLDLVQDEFLGMIGSPEHGLYDFIDYLLISLLQKRNEHPVEIRIIDKIDRHFEMYKRFEDNVLHTIIPANITGFVTDIETVMAERYKKRISGQDIADEHGLMVLLINNQECYEMIDRDPLAPAMFQNLTGKYRQMGFCVIMAQLPNASMAYGAPTCIRAARDILKSFLFCNLEEQRNVDFTSNVIKEYSKPLGKNECYYVEGSHVNKLRTVRVEAEKEVEVI